LESTCSAEETHTFWKRNSFNAWLLASAEKHKTFEKKLRYALNYKDPVNVVNALHFIALKRDADMMQVISNPYYMHNKEVSLLIAFDETDTATTNVLRKIATNYTVQEKWQNNAQYVCTLQSGNETLFWVVLVKRYENWYIEQIREP
jgi:hypothetical protein